MIRFCIRMVIFGEFTNRVIRMTTKPIRGDRIRFIFEACFKPIAFSRYEGGKYVIEYKPPLRVSLNCFGGYADDSLVRKLIKRGFFVRERGIHHEKPLAFRGYPYYMRTHLIPTEKAMKYYKEKYLK